MFELKQDRKGVFITEKSKNYRFESLLDGSVLTKDQLNLVNSHAENQACDPCDCNCNHGCDKSCRCN